MKPLPATLFAFFVAVGCNGRDDPPAPVTAPMAAPASSNPRVERPNPRREPARIAPADWLSHPIYEKRNPYDLPLEYELKIPGLPPKGVMDPCPELPPEETQ